jgi:hypothetical protein
MCCQASSLSLHKFWKLVQRTDLTVCEYEEVSGGLILTEKRPDGPYAPGAIVASRKFGVGVFMGIAGDGYVVAFVMDSGYWRLVSRQEAITVLRSLSTHVVNAVTINALPLPLNVNAATEKQLMPCDAIRIGDELAFFLGTAVSSYFFETEIMVANDLGAGYLELEREFVIVSEIYVGGSRKSVVATVCGPMELNVNLHEFRNFALLPLDVVCIGDRLAEICGFAGDDLYMQYLGARFAEKFNPNADFELVYRRARVPTRRTFCTTEQKSVSAWIDLEHFRGCRCLPYDVVDYQGHRMIILGLVGESTFVVANWETLEYSLFMLPIGKTQRIVRSLFGGLK